MYDSVSLVHFIKATLYFNFFTIVTIQKGDTSEIILRCEVEVVHKKKCLRDELEGCMKKMKKCKTLSHIRKSSLSCSVGAIMVWPTWTPEMMLTLSKLLGCQAWDLLSFQSETCGCVG